MTRKIKLHLATTLLIFSDKPEKIIFRELKVKKIDVYRHTIIKLQTLLDELKEDLAKSERRKIRK
jgi:hypothetical protein